MSAVSDPGMLTADDLNPTDRLCVRVLREGRATPAYIADVGGYSTGNVRTQLKHLASHDHVAKIYDGLYQLVDDPYSGGEIDVPAEAERRLEEDRVPSNASDDIADSGLSGDDDGGDSEPAESAETPSESVPATTSHTRDAGEGTASGDDVPPVAREDVDTDLEVAYREYLDDRPPKKRHGKEIVIDALLLLREHEYLETGDIQEQLYPDYEEHYSTERTMWNAVSRYLRDLPGFEKPDDYGGWGYAGDDEVWAAIQEDSGT